MVSNPGHLRMNSFGGSEGEGGDGEGGIGGSAGGESAAAHDEEVGVVVAAQAGVDHRVFGVVAHACGAQDVAGTKEFIGVVPLAHADAPKNVVVSVTRHGESLAHVRLHLIMNARAGNAVNIGEFRVESDTVVSVRLLLGEGGNPKFSRSSFGQPVIEF